LLVGRTTFRKNVGRILWGKGTYIRHYLDRISFVRKISNNSDVDENLKPKIVHRKRRTTSSTGRTVGRVVMIQTRRSIIRTYDGGTCTGTRRRFIVQSGRLGRGKKKVGVKPHQDFGAWQKTRARSRGIFGKPSPVGAAYPFVDSAGDRMGPKSKQP